MDWITAILTGAHPQAIGAAGNRGPVAALQQIQADEQPLPQDQEAPVPATVVDSYSGSLPAGASINRTIPVDTTALARIVVACSDPAVVVRLVSPGGQVIDAQSAAGDPAIDWVVAGDEAGNTAVIAITGPAAGPWQVVADGSATTAPAQVAIEVTCVSDFLLLATAPEQASLGVRVPLAAALALESAAEPGIVPGTVFTAVITAPDGTSTTLTLSDDGTHGDAAAGDGLHAELLDLLAQPGDYRILWRAEGLHPTSGEAFRRVVRGGFTMAAPGGFIAGIASHAPVDADDNGYPDAVVLEVRVEVAAAGDFTLAGRLVDGARDAAVSAATDFTVAEPGGGVVTLLFTPRELPQGAEFGPFEVAGLQLARRSPDEVMLDTFTGSHEVPLTLYNEISRRIRLSGDLAFGGVRIGEQATRQLSVHNDGWEPLSVATLQLPDGFSAAFEGRVDPGAAVEVPVTFAPAAETSYGGEILANSDAPAGENRLAVSATGLAVAIPFDTWLANAGVPPELAGPLDDPNGDGLSNMMAYLFDIEPALMPPPGHRSALPAAGLAETGVDRFITLTYRHNKHAVGLIVSLEASESLLNDSWYPIEADAAIDVGSDPGTGDPLRQLRVRIGDQPRRFLRLVVKQE